MEYLYEKWRAIALPCSLEESNLLFAHLQRHYSERKRHYHTFEHLAAMFRLFDEYREEILEVDNLALSIFFHDVIYQATRKDNEEASAVFAEKHLMDLGVSAQQAMRTGQFIRATQSHQLPPDSHPDLAWLLDFDLAVLGAPWETYQVYSQQIRREYRIYPTLLYRPGRRKALGAFLERAFIFQTDAFRQKYESRARLNLTREIALLSV